MVAREYKKLYNAFAAFSKMKTYYYKSWSKGIFEYACEVVIPHGTKKIIFFAEYSCFDREGECLHKLNPDTWHYRYDLYVIIEGTSKRREWFPAKTYINELVCLDEDCSPGEWKKFRAWLNTQSPSELEKWLQKIIDISCNDPGVIYPEEFCDDDECFQEFWMHDYRFYNVGCFDFMNEDR